MTAPSPKTAEITKALDELLSAIRDDEIRRPRTWAGVVSITAADLMAADPDDLWLDSALQAPVAKACREMITKLGKRLHKDGGTKLMLAVSEAVCDMDEAQWSSRANILDKRWDRIGAGTDDAWFC